MSASRASKAMNLSKYLASGLLILGMTSMAWAGVVSVDITNPDISGLNAGAANGQEKVVNFWPFYWNYPNSLNLYNNFTGFGDATTGIASPSVLEFAAGNSGTANPTKFGSGEFVGPSVSEWGGHPISTAFKYGGVESPDFGPNSFMGFRIDGGSQDYIYGYIEVTWSSATDTFEILSAAYESVANVAIQTPSAPVPEPATGAMVALLMGSGALSQWRKNRRDKKC